MNGTAKYFFKKTRGIKFFKKYFFISGVFVLLIATFVNIPLKASEQPLAYALVFETIPGGVTIAVEGIGTQTSTPGEYGAVTFYVNGDTYHYTATKLGPYRIEEGMIQVTSDTKVIVSVLPGKIDITLDMQDYVPIWQSTVTGTLTVRNTQEFSYLDWYVYSWPDFGYQWIFAPANGFRVESGIPDISSVSFIAPFPRIPGMQFSGNVVVVNAYDPDDYDVYEYIFKYSKEIKSDSQEIKIQQIQNSEINISLENHLQLLQQAS
ncbi:MAG: hypothetical protein QXX20_05670 [Candidatus Thermoplasmatota archaeon]